MTKQDRERLRSLAYRQLELANEKRNDEILYQWNCLGNGIREKPTVRLLFYGFRHEVLYNRMQCEGETARKIEEKLLATMAGRELFDDDTPISPTFDVTWNAWVSPFGIRPESTHAAGENQLGYHIDPVISDLSEEFEKLRGGQISFDREKTEQFRREAEEAIGDILPVRMVTESLYGAMTNPLVLLMGMESFYCAMYDTPDELHAAMDLACSMYEKFYDFLEEEKLLTPTAGITPVMQESFAFNHELPTENVTRTNQVWGFLESQETTAVSPEMFGEFVFPYQDRLVKRLGLLSYGCCERVDAIFPDYLSKWKNLRKLSVSPFNDDAKVGEYLRGSGIVFYSKPRAEYLTIRGPLDTEAIRAYFKDLAQKASGCLFEVAQREAGTIYGDFNRGREYVRIAKETIEKYWKP